MRVSLFGRSEANTAFDRIDDGPHAWVCLRRIQQWNDENSQSDLVHWLPEAQLQWARAHSVVLVQTVIS